MVKTFKIKPKFEHECFIFDGDFNDLISFFHKHNLEVLKTTQDGDDYIIYYIDICGEPKEFDLNKGHYVWIDETGLVNSCIEDYFRENFDYVKKKNKEK